MSSLSVPAIGDSQDWELNYREAAIYLQEGENNDRFDTHPRNQNALPAYVMVHNIYFYIMDLAAAMLVLLLALVEQPAVDALQLQPIVSLLFLLLTSFAFSGKSEKSYSQKLVFLMPSKVIL